MFVGDSLSGEIEKDDDHSHEGANGDIQDLKIKKNKISFSGANGSKFKLKLKDEKVLKGRISGSHQLTTTLSPAS